MLLFEKPNTSADFGNRHFCLLKQLSSPHEESAIHTYLGRYSQKKTKVETKLIYRF